MVWLTIILTVEMEYDWEFPIKASFFSKFRRYILPSYTCSPEEYRHDISGLTYGSHNWADIPIEDGIRPLEFFPLGSLLSSWPANNFDPTKWKESRAHPNSGKNIARFNYSDVHEMNIAQKYREAELPFVLTNIPALDDAIRGPFSLRQLLDRYQSDYLLVEESISDQFTFYRVKHPSPQYPDWTAPQNNILMRFHEFLEVAEAAETRADLNNATLYYYIISAKESNSLPW